MRWLCVGFARASAPLEVSCILAALLLSATPAEAQGLFQSLFGWGSSNPPAAPAPAPNTPAAPAAQSPVVLTPGGNSYQPSGSRSSSPLASGDREHAGSSPSGKVKTVCVRMCDGYYFPISASTSRANLYRDASRCKASCGAEGRIFSMPVASTDMDDAVDLGGRPYVRMPIAFKYRKSLVSGCQCRPEPWSEASMERHRTYARAETENDKAGESAGTKMASGSQPAGDAANDPKSAESQQAEMPQISVARITMPPKPPVVRVAVPKQAPAQPAVQPPQQPVAPQAQPAPSQQSASWSWNWPQQKYTWPGDAPPQTIRR